MKLLYTLMICTLTCITYSTAVDPCPEREDIYPCYCDNQFGDVEATCTGLTTVAQLKKVVEGIKGFKVYKLTILRSNISDVPNDIFQGADITRLDVIESDIHTSGAPGEPQLVGLEKSLKVLNIFGHDDFGVKKPPMKALSLGNLEELRALHVEFNNIPKLGNEWFEKGPSGLKMVVFFADDIEELGDRVFVNLVELNHLMVASNLKLTTLSRSIFPKPATYLETLKLDRNGMKDLPEDIFSDMPALKTVDLYDNQFSTIAEPTWSGIWDQLDFIDFYMNPMECDSRIKWITKRNSLFYKIVGNCVKPEKLQGKDLSLLQPSDFE